jgi:hypothetical protein
MQLELVIRLNINRAWRHDLYGISLYSKLPCFSPKNSSLTKYFTVKRFCNDSDSAGSVHLQL